MSPELTKQFEERSAELRKLAIKVVTSSYDEGYIATALFCIRYGGPTEEEIATICKQAAMDHSDTLPDPKQGHSANPSDPNCEQL